MQNIIIKQKTSLLLVSILHCASVFATDNAKINVPVFSITELKEDLMVWRKTLEKTHANLYLYTPKTNLDNTFDSFYSHIDTPMTALQFYSYISPLVSIIKDGHNYIHPDNNLTDYYNKHALFFPFHVSYLDKKLWIDMNLSGDSTLKVGTEILSINDVDVDTIMQELLKRMPRDGYNETYPLWILNQWFREYYSYTFNHPETFTLVIKTDNNVSTTKVVHALSKDSILHTRKKLYPDRLMVNENKKAITYNTIDSIQTGVLKIYTFSSKTKKEYHQSFKKTIKDVFKNISQHKTENLVIDLRNNQGGATEYGAYILSHIIPQPFYYVKEYDAVKKLHANTTEDRLKKLHMLRTKKVKPNANHFSGKVFLLINGGSFSNSGIMSSVLASNKRAIIIGEETGGNKAVLTSVFGIKSNTILPNTKIVCDKPDYRTIITDMTLNDGHGVLPDYTVIPSIDDIISNKDIVMEKVLELIVK